MLGGIYQNRDKGRGKGSTLANFVLNRGLCTDDFTGTGHTVPQLSSVKKRAHNPPK